VRNLADVQQAHGAADVEERAVRLYARHHARHDLAQRKVLHLDVRAGAAVAEQQALVDLWWRLGH
jgi:hypothetical protein